MEAESEDELMEYGVTPIMHYDPAGRLVQTDFLMVQQLKLSLMPATKKLRPKRL